jgi:predicted ArsR family transcriptional regulator
MAIDNPIDAAEAQFKESEQFPLDLVSLPFELGVPHLAFLLKFVKLIKDHLSSNGKRERARIFLELLRDQQNVLEVLGQRFDRLHVKVEDLAEALQIAVNRDAEAFNDNKRDHYLKIIGNAVRSEEEIKDLATFIRDVEVLGEEDIKVLKVLNSFMNQPGDTHHQLTFILSQRRRDLAIRIAGALGIPSDEPFNHEVGYSICMRLRGFGLAQQVPFAGTEEIPIGEYCFRPSTRGLMLLKLMGENVANWQGYFAPKARPKPA